MKESSGKMIYSTIREISLDNRKNVEQFNDCMKSHCATHFDLALFLFMYPK